MEPSPHSGDAHPAVSQAVQNLEAKDSNAAPPHTESAATPHTEQTTAAAVAASPTAATGSYGDRWLYCAWCWRWGKCLADERLNGAEPLTDVDGVGTMCDRCLELEEPPWWPNNRQRYATYLQEFRLLPRALLRLEATIIIKLASFVTENTP